MPRESIFSVAARHQGALQPRKGIKIHELVQVYKTPEEAELTASQLRRKGLEIKTTGTDLQPKRWHVWIIRRW